MNNRQANSRRWYWIENAVGDPDTSQIFLYNEIGTFGTTAEDFVSDLQNIKTPKIEMHISSPGGMVFDGIAIYNAIRNHPADVTVRIDGVAASAASFVAMAGDRILAERTASLMIHDGQGIAAGNSQDMRNLAVLLDNCSDNIASIYAERAGGTVEEWRERMRAETWYTAAEAKAVGLVDEVSTGRFAIKNSMEFDLSQFGFRYAGRDAAPAPTDMACPAHDTATSGGTWDAGAQMKQMPSPMPVAMAKRMFGWIDASMIEDGQMPKAAGKLPHHEMGENGPGPANLAGVRNALARLSQSDIPGGDMEGVRAHLRAHLDAQPADHLDPPAEAGFLMPVLDLAAIRNAVESLEDIPIDPRLITAAIRLGVNDCPAPNPPASPEPEPPGPDLSIDLPGLRRAIREVTP